MHSFAKFTGKGKDVLKFFTNMFGQELVCSKIKKVDKFGTSEARKGSVIP